MGSCTRPVRVKVDGIDHFYPCRKCQSCKKSRSLEWTVRLLHELPAWDYKASFITLTYDDEHIGSPSLQRKDLTDFWKRLRKQLGNRHIKYYACGEYGTVTNRKHFHAIVFGLDGSSEVDRDLVAMCWKKCDYTRFLNGGFDVVTPADISYVAGYVQKKYGDTKKYEKLGLLPPYQVQSKGLGYNGLLHNQPLLEQIVQTGTVRFGVSCIKVPPYYVHKLGMEDSEVVKQHRQEMFVQRVQDLNKLGYSLRDILGQSFCLGNTDYLYNRDTQLAREQREQNEEKENFYRRNTL